MADDLVAFLTARLDEDQKRAAGLFFACREPGRRPVFDFAGAPAAAAFWKHFGPGRMLCEVAAKRAIMARHCPVDQYGSDMCQGCGTGEITMDYETAISDCHDLRAIAAVYSGHRGYQQEWAPER